MATTIFDEAEENQDLRSWLEDSRLGHTRVAEQWGFSEKAVRRWRARYNITLNPQAPVVDAEPETQEDTTTADGVIKGSIDVTPDGAQVNNVVVTSPVNEDWSNIFSLFNLSADHFVVVDDTVRMSTWQQSKRTDDGKRDTIQLWSYSARFRKVNADDVSPATVERWRADLIREHVHIPDFGNTIGSGTYVMLVADPQLGKKGTEEAVDNWKRGIREHLSQAEVLGPEALHIGFMGDEHEGALHNYANQPHTIELNFTKQLELDYDMRVWTLREAAALGLPISVSSVISNHGEWTRNGAKDVVTTRNDNSSTHIARQVKKLFDELEPFGGPSIDWTIGDGAPGLVIDLSGVKSYMSHGYVEKGRGSTTEARMKNAIENQILGNTDQLGDVRLYYMAHYHHLYSNTFAQRTMWGCPALEATKSSEYMLDQWGVWSPAGLLGMMVGTSQGSQGWSNANVF